MALQGEPTQSMEKNEVKNSIKSEKYMPPSPLNESFLIQTGCLFQDQDSLVHMTTTTVVQKASLLKTCGQSLPIAIETIFESLNDVEKLNEGSYGEVYTGQFQNGRKNIFKIYPVNGSKLTKYGHSQIKYAEAEAEIEISNQLNNLRYDRAKSNFTSAFAHCFYSRVLKGNYPDVLKTAWVEWSKKYKSYNDFPDFDDAQHYVVLESEVAGDIIEHFPFETAKETYSVLMQLTFALAAAEKELEFEHRDLHLGNLLIRPSGKRSQKYKVDGTWYRIPTHGLKVIIIDFALSRGLNPKGKLLFTDLLRNNKDFCSGNSATVYGKMRNEFGNNFGEFHPKTNIYWLKYLTTKFIRSSRISYSCDKNGVHQAYLKQLKQYKNIITTYNSAFDYVKSVHGQKFEYTPSTK